MDGKPGPVIQRLRDLGYWVDVEHVQFAERDGEQYEGKYPHTQIRAKTTVVIYNGLDPQELVTAGLSECSVLDQFNKSIGLRIALGRALHANPDLKAQVQG